MRQGGESVVAESATGKESNMGTHRYERAVRAGAGTAQVPQAGNASRETVRHSRSIRLN